MTEGFERIPFMEAYKLLRSRGVKRLKAAYWASQGLQQYVIRSNKS